jgi:hypothetical protein
LQSAGSAGVGCSRSFESPVWVNAFKNVHMNYAIAMAQLTLVIALVIPGLNTEVF